MQDKTANDSMNACVVLILKSMTRNGSVIQGLPSSRFVLNMNMSEQELLEISQRLRALHHKKHNAMQQAGKAQRLYEAAQKNLVAAKTRVESADQLYNDLCSQIQELTPSYNAACKSVRESNDAWAT